MPLFDTILFALFLKLVLCEEFFIVPSQHSSCLNCTKSLITLSQFANNSTNYINSNTTLFMYGGNHSLQAPGIVINNYTNFSMISVNDSHSGARIFCSKNTNLIISNTGSVHISDVTFIGCSSNQVRFVKHLTIEHSKFSGQNNSGTPLTIIKSNAYLISSSFVFNQVGSDRNHFKFSSYFPLNHQKSFSATVGGAMIVNNTTLAIENCSFHNNSANIGGAIFSEFESNITISNSLFSSNSATNCDSRLCFGGALFIDGSGRMTLQNSTFRNGKSTGDGGIAVAFNAVLVISQSNFYDNMAEQLAGVMRALHSTFVIDSSTFRCNSVYGDGGVMYADGSSIITLNNSNFFNNSAKNFGGILFLQSNVSTTIISSRMQNNTAKSGGAIYATSSTNVTINSSIFMHNKANCDFREVIVNEGGVVLLNKNSIVNVYNSSFNHNTARFGGGVISLMESVDAGKSTIKNSTFISNMAGEYGGVVQLQYSSSISVFDSNFMNNQAFIDGGVFDSFVSSIVKVYRSHFVNNSAGSRGGVSASKRRSTFHSTESVFYNNTSDILGAIVFLRNESGITTHGCNFSQNIASYGGAIVSEIRCNLIVVNCTFYSNTAKMNGAILYVHANCKIMIDNSNFINNIANNDGVIMVSDSSSIVVNRSNFRGNEAGHDGGVAYAYDNSFIMIVSCNCIDNRAGDSGGALYGRKNSNITITKSVIINCTAQNFGGSVFIQLDSNALIKDSNFTKSSANSGGVISAYVRSNVCMINCKLSKNTATISGGVMSALKNCSIIVQMSSLTFNLGGYGGVSFAFQNSYIVFNNCEVFNNKVEFEGIIKIRQQCNLTITKSTFKNNTAGNGGILYLQASNATIEGSLFELNHAIGKGGVIYGSDHSIVDIYLDIFYYNMAKYGGVLTLLDDSIATIEHSEFIANRANLNGGTIFMSESFICISNCTLSFSTARNGGVIYATYSSIQISNSLFSYNNASESGGTVKAYAVTSLMVLSSSFVNNIASKSGGVLHLKEQTNATISHSHFEKNKADLYGGAISASAMSTVVITRSIFNNNKAENGGALAAQASSILSQSNDQTEEFDGETRICNNAANYGGGIYLTKSKLYFKMETVFSYNQASSLGGGIHAVNSSIFIESTVDIVSNVAESGGGVSLANSKLYDRASSTIIVNLMSNNAADYGGALYIDDNAQRALCFTDPYNIEKKECFFQTEANQLKINLNENHANSSGDDLFGGLLDRCTVNFVANLSGVVYFKEIRNMSFDTVSSEPVRICPCNNSKKDCGHLTHTVPVRQGDRFTISVVAVDQVSHPVPAVLHSSFREVSLPVSQTLRKIGSVCSTLEYEVSFLNVGEDHELTLYAEGPCTHKDISKLLIIVNVIACSCAPGFMPTDRHTECICICDRRDKLFSEYIKKCNSSTESVIREGTFWITYLHHNDSGLSHFFIFPYCPMDYCHPSSKSVSINFNHPDGSDAQCTNNRAGILCGSCQASYSLSLGTSRCIKCPDNWYGQFVGITIAALFAGVVLVLLFLWLNLTVAVGTLNSVIFYANIIDANRSMYFVKTYTHILVFVSWLNLDLGIDACFFEGMDTFTKTWIQLAFPTYIIFLVIVIISISSCSFKFSSILGKKSPVETLATLILLSYTKFLEIIITSLSFVSFKYPNSTRTYQWLPDASVDYGKGKHIALICVSILILTFGLIYTVLIFSWQWLHYCPTLKFLSGSKRSKLHIFISTYHTPNTAKHRYWTGLLLLVRVIVYLISTFSISADPRITLLFTIVIVCCLQMYKTAFKVRVYRTCLLSAMESFVFFNIAIFTTITWYTFDDQCNKNKEILQRVASIISVGAIIFSCLLVVSFHIYKYGSKKVYSLGQNTKLCKKLTHQISRDWIPAPKTSIDRELDVYQLFDISDSYQDCNSSYSPPPLHSQKEPTSSSISLADCEEL